MHGNTVLTKHTYYRAEVSYYLSVCLHIICDLCYLMPLHSLTSYCSLSNFCLLLNCVHMIVSSFTAYYLNVKVFTDKSSLEICSYTKEFLQKMHHKISVESFQVPLLSPTHKSHFNIYLHYNSGKVYCQLFLASLSKCC